MNALHTLVETCHVTNVPWEENEKKKHRIPNATPRSMS